MRNFIDLVESGFGNDLERMIKQEHDRKVIYRDRKDLPAHLYHGTSLSAALDILSNNKMEMSKKTRDKGPQGISFSREYIVAQRFATIKNQGTGTLMQKPLPGVIMKFNTDALFETKLPIVRYKGAYSSREQEERVLGTIQPVVQCIDHIKFYGISLRPRDVLNRVEHIVNGTNNHRLENTNQDIWIDRLVAFKKYLYLFSADNTRWE